MNADTLFKDFSKCSNYALLTILAHQTIRAMGRFRDVNDELIVRKVYTRLKELATDRDKQ